MFFHRYPFDHFAAAERDVDHLLRRTFAVGRSRTAPFTTPLTTTADADGVTVRAELPGIDPAGISVSVEDRVLTIRAERQAEAREHGRTRVQERSYGAVTHAFRLAEDLDAEAISAKAEHGVLTVHIPKRAEAKPRQIPVQPS
jgi:HSP20 family protein